MVPRPNLDSDSIYILCPVHSRPRNPLPLRLRRASTLIVATPLGIEKFDSNVFHFLISIKAFIIWFSTHSHLFFVPFLGLEVNGKVKAPFKAKTFRSSPHQLTICTSAYDELWVHLKLVHQSIWGPLRPKVGIIAHLIVSDLLIYPFSFKELTHT